MTGEDLPVHGLGVGHHPAPAVAAAGPADARRAAYGAAGVQRARARYRWARVAADTEAVYRQVLSTRRAVEAVR